MSKELDLQGVPVDLSIVREVLRGSRPPDHLSLFKSQLSACRTGRMTTARIEHVRKQGEALEIELQELAIRAVVERPSLVEAHFEMVCRDGVLEYFLFEYAKLRSLDTKVAKSVVRGHANLQPIDDAIGWTDPEGTAQLYDFLNEIEFSDFCAGYDKERILAANVYKAYQVVELDEMDRKHWLKSLLSQTQAFYRQAVAGNLGVLSFRWG